MNNKIDKWKQIKSDWFTPGGDPIYICPKCESPESKHCYGVESRENFKTECPVCKTKLEY